MTTAWIDTRQVLDTSLDAPNFQCAPKVLTQRDTVILRAEVPHGGWLLLERPDGTSFDLVSPIPDEGYGKLLDSEAFKNTLIVRFRADIRSRPQVYGRDTLEQVFNLPGEYTFTIGENLGTEYDEEDPNWHCKIRVAASSQ